MKRHCTLFLVACLAALASTARAQYDHQSLLKMEKKVQATIKKVMPATVALLANQGQGLGAGSGTIVSADGIILTAAHVLGNAEEVQVIFPDGKRVMAKALGRDYSRDVGMAKIVEEGKWPHVKLGDSTKVKVTDLFLAMGHPEGYDVRRSPPARIGRAYNNGSERFIMTDCVLMGGDSGGPLFDLDGRLVAIHSFIGFNLSQNNHAPVEVAKEHWERLLAGERFGRGFGQDTRRLDPDHPVLGIGLGGEGSTVLIQQVFADSPAEKAGLKEGDAIAKLDGKAVRDHDHFFNLMAGHKPGDAVVFTVDRDGKQVQSEVTLARRGDLFGRNGEPRRPRPEPEPEPAAGPPFLGAVFSEGAQGVVVDEVLADSGAEQAQLRAGDILIRIGKTRIQGVDDVVGLVRGKKPGDELELSVRRGGKVRKLKLTLGTRP